MSLATLLQNIPFFDRLSEGQLQDLTEIGKTESWEANRIVFHEGDPPDSLYLILEGVVQISKKDETGAEIPLATLRRGDFFGEMALVDGEPRSATASTREPCQFFVLGRYAFTELLSKAPRLIPGLFSSIVGKLRSVNQQFLLEVLEKQRLREEMERERHRLLAQFIALSNEAGTVEQSLRIALEQICSYTAWPVGHVYVASDDLGGDLVSSSVWYQRSPELVEPFQRLSELTRFSSGVGLPGRVLATGKPVWLQDLAQELTCPRSTVARECGLRAAFGLPVFRGKQVVAVLEFFSDQTREPDTALLEAMTPVTSHLGQLLERKRYEEQLLHNAFHDPLTDLPNRARFLDRLELSLERAKRDNKYLFAVIFLDLDRFKVINDSLGHLTGDELLSEVGRRLQNCVRAVDTVGRLGGDEFAILVEDLEQWSNILPAVERIRKKMQLPIQLSGREVFTTASMGIALSSPRYDRGEDMLRDADIAMYRAKMQGPGRHEIFEPAMHEQAMKVLQLQVELRRILERQELLLYYQPIISLDTGQINGFEALLRWQHPKRGLLLPGEFLRVAQETEMIFPITQWILEEACRQLKRWRAQLPGQSALSLNVNLSAKYLAKQGLIPEILTVVSQAGLHPSALHLEITEDQIIAAPEMIARVLLQMSEAGIRVFIDDFGTGYSSLKYLSRLRVYGLKIDQSFLENIDRDERNAAIVRSTVSLGGHLGLEVVAEGIETAEQLDYLREVKCQYGQGYYFSHPLDQSKATRLLQQGLQISGKRKVEASRLQAFDLFAGISEEALAELAGSVEELTARPETLLIRQGQVGKDLYLLEEGSVGVYRGDPDSGGQLMAVLQAPSVFGERAIFDPERIRTASVKSMTKLRLLTLPINTFILFLRLYPALGEKLRALASRR